jgi:hypothetical protein
MDGISLAPKAFPISKNTTIEGSAIANREQDGNKKAT